jgi:hypothetical protein
VPGERKQAVVAGRFLRFRPELFKQQFQRPGHVPQWYVLIPKLDAVSTDRVQRRGDGMQPRLRSGNDLLYGFV